ncbi:MAG: alpha/beta fold hydrolase [Syntrophomonadaceae bacterium]
MKKQFTLMLAIFLALILTTSSLSAGQNTFLDIPYGNLSAAQTVDIYLPDDAARPFPVIVSIHGGGWCAGDKMGPDLETAKAGLQRGYAVVSVNYRLSEEAIAPAQIHDIKAAIRFIRANADDYHLDPNRIAVWGSSAGGALAALAGTSAGVEELQDLSIGNPTVSDRVQAVVDWCGPVNLATMDAQFKASGIKGELMDRPDSYGSTYVGKRISLVPDRVQMVNAENYITPDDPPFYLQHGTADTLVPYQQSPEFAARLATVLGKDKVHLVTMPGKGHDGQGFNNPESVNNVLDFLDATLKLAVPGTNLSSY